MEYDELLKRAYENLPKKTLEHERFEVPQADVLIQGNKTVIRNFTSICEKLGLLGPARRKLGNRNPFVVSLAGSVKRSFSINT